jgi:hypothetical protein
MFNKQVDTDKTALYTMVAVVIVFVLILIYIFSDTFSFEGVKNLFKAVIIFGLFAGALYMVFSNSKGNADKGIRSNKQCPKCDGHNIKTLKTGFWKRYVEASMQMWTLGIRKMTPPLNVCRDCGFSWEDR